MKAFQYLLLVMFILVFGTSAEARRPDKPGGNKEVKDQNLKPRAGDCAPAIEQIDQNINNVRARLTTGGDVWWDVDGDGKYIVPNIDPASGLPEVSSIFAASIWIGGYDSGNNLKLAGNTYRTSTSLDWWSGPLDPVTGAITKEQCKSWDMFFKVYGTEIDEHLANYRTAVLNNVAYEPSSIPLGVLGWPGKKNPYFRSVHPFDLPNTEQGLAGFWDQDGDDIYDPTQGDYPIIEIRGCATPQYPHEMFFWIYNDNGGIHSSSKSPTAIQMEVQVQSFAYSTNNELNDMTFQRYKLINRATDKIERTYFAIWVDPDLGCHTDDYIGCDTSRSMMYVYNDDVQDGTNGCNCDNGVPTYCTDVPILGVDYFRGPLDENGVELGMSSFTYFNNPAVNNPPLPTTDPDVAREFYNYMSGKWKDGTPFFFGGTGYGGSGTPTNYAFTGAPNEANSWSMCTVQGLKGGDRRTVQASGPFRLFPGNINELIIGVPWVADQAYPCPSLSELQAADDIAQDLFDNCFDILEGPDAPKLDIIEMDRQFIFVLTNDTLTSNNKNLQYAERVPGVPEGFSDTFYVFEGYKVYQLDGPTVGSNAYNDPDKARLVAQVDVKNNVSTIYNWTPIDDPNPQEADKIYVPVAKVEGANQGLRTTFRITEDAFSTSQDRKLVNHKKYYFIVVAYAYNNFFNFDKEQPALSQKIPYIEGIEIAKTPYVAIPRPITDIVMNAAYGDGAEVTRLDGQGVGGSFVDLKDGIREQLALGTIKDTLAYKEGLGPIRVNIYNPIDIADGEFILTFTDTTSGDNYLDKGARWNLINVNNPAEVFLSDASIEGLNEQVIGKYGFSILINQTGEPGDKSTPANGYIGKAAEFADPSQPWFMTFNDVDPISGLPDGNPLINILNFVKNAGDEPDASIDPAGGLTNFVKGGTQVSADLPITVDATSFVPFMLADFRYTPGAPYFTPSLLDGTNNMQTITRPLGPLSRLNNVDIVMTPNKELWSRCVVLETVNRYYSEKGQGGAASLELRKAPSVGKEDANGDGYADPDGDPQQGLGWFPGYAVNVETGQRLNILFGENSFYSEDFNPFIDSVDGQPGRARGRDMMYNPTSQLLMNNLPGTDFMAQFYMGGQHFIYVTDTKYDSCKSMLVDLTKQLAIIRARAYGSITWAAMSMVRPGFELNSYAEGLIPTETVIKLRVDNRYATSGTTGLNNGHPQYKFAIRGKKAEALSSAGVQSQLDMINVVPNPYYAYSQYETSQFSNVVKITNLPAKCVVTIYSLDGKFIRQYKRNEARLPISGGDPGLRSTLITPDLEWDIKNSKGIPVASGVYLIHVNAEGLGERVIKWFSINRAFDPSGL